MGLVTVPSFGSDPATITAAGLDGKVDPLVTEFNGNIENANIKAGAAIAYSKLNLTGTITNTDISTTADIAASKLLLSGIAQTVSYASNGVENWFKGADIASATTTDIGASTGNVVDVTGTTTITGLGTVQAGTFRIVRFTGALTLTHNATSLLLPSAANITTAANDVAGFVSLGSGNWKCVWYQRYDGTALGGFAAQSDQETATSTTLAVTPGRQQFHPSACKAWCSFNGTGTPAMNGTPYNFDASITDGGAGIYSLTFTNDLSSANYCVVVTCNDVSNSSICGTVTAKATTGITIKTRQTDNQSAQDPTWVDVVVYGDI